MITLRPMLAAAGGLPALAAALAAAGPGAAGAHEKLTVPRKKSGRHSPAAAAEYAARNLRRAIEDVVRYMRRQSGVWLTTCEEVAQ